jgi:hypothetical protein
MSECVCTCSYILNSMYVCVGIHVCVVLLISIMGKCIGIIIYLSLSLFIIIIVITITHLSYCILCNVGLQDCARLVASTVSRGWVCICV